jgi:hypothetical protein
MTIPDRAGRESLLYVFVPVYYLARAVDAGIPHHPDDVLEAITRPARDPGNRRQMSPSR